MRVQLDPSRFPKAGDDQVRRKEFYQKLGQQLGSHGARWGDLLPRLASALLLVPLALLMMWLGGAAWGITTSLIGIGIWIEWVSLCGSSWRRPMVGLLLAAYALAWGGMMLWGAPPLIIGVLALSLLVILVRPWLGAGLLYTGLVVWALVWLRDDVNGFANLLYLLPVVWASDIGAYASGRVLGGPKLAPLISPGKTWSGALGGVLAASLVGAAIGGGLAGEPTRAAWLAALLAVVSQMGDLAESWAKRHFGVKDSGRLIPGHGGLLDRLDGMLAASLVAVGLALIAGPGQYIWR